MMLYYIRLYSVMLYHIIIWYHTVLSYVILHYILFYCIIIILYVLGISVEATQPIPNSARFRVMATALSIRRRPEVWSPDDIWESFGTSRGAFWCSSELLR